MENQIAKIENAELALIIEKAGIEKAESVQVTENYAKYFVELSEIESLKAKINFENPTEIDEKIARDLRLRTVKIRTAAETLKDERKKSYLLRGNLEQSVYNLIKDGCKLVEDNFLQVEKAREIAEKKRKAELFAERAEKISEYVENVSIYPLAEMTENDFDNLVIGFQVAKERKAEAERIQAEKIAAELQAEKERIELQRLENERLKKEAAELAEKQRIEFERIEKEREIERKKQAEILAAQQKEAAEKARIEAEKQAKIQAELKAKADSEAKIAAEKLAKERAEAQRLAAELKAKADSEAAEKAAKLESERKAANAPEKQKIKMFAESLRNLKRPTVTGEAANILQNVEILLSKVDKYIAENLEKL